MENFEKNLINAARRKKRAESKSKLSISHWLGELHSHTGRRLAHPLTPEEEIEQREGSNCATIPLEILARYHAEEMLNQYIAITNHSRDASPEAAIKGVTDWFNDMYLNNESWLKKHFNKSRNELGENDLITIRDRASENAEKLVYYKDERLKETLKEIDSLSEKKLPIKILRGVEVNLLPNGSLDTPMVDEGKFEIVNCSIHPEVDNKKLAPILKNPEKYTDLTIKGINHPKTNIISHIGYGAKKEFVDELDWEKIADSARENNVAIEINLKELTEFIYKEIMDYNKYPKDEVYYKDYFKEKLSGLIPLINSEKIKKALKPYIKEGLKFAFNTDEHKSKFIDTKISKNNIEAEFKKRDFRFWRCIKILEKYFNETFKDLGIKEENIINTYKHEKLQRFLRKEI